jgi:putative oxidoreductase
MLKTIGRYLFALPFLIFGLLHFINAQGMAAIVPGWIPGHIFWIILTGLAMIAAAVSILIQVWDRQATILLGVMLLIFVLTIHLPNTINDPSGAMGDLLKDTALAGASWLYAGFIARSNIKATQIKT